MTDAQRRGREMRREPIIIDLPAPASADQLLTLDRMNRDRLERNVADTVSRIRAAADEIEREAKRNIASAAATDRDLEFQTYPRVAGQVIHSVQTMLFNLRLDSTIEAASDAEAARTEGKKS